MRKYSDLQSSSGLVPGTTASGAKSRYTVPTIHHVPTNTYMMESGPISQFLESTYPDPSVPLTSELGHEIETKARAIGGKASQTSVMPREVGILSPRAAEYFRRTREAALGHRLEDLLGPEKEEQVWKAVDGGMRAVGELMRTNKAEGPFILGAQPSYTDFFFAGVLQSTRMVDEGVFQRYTKYPGFMEIYEACLPYMEKRD